MDSRKWDHDEDSKHFLMGQLLGSSMRSLIDDWLGLTVLEAGKRRPALKNRLVGDADAQNYFFTENL